MGQGYLNVFLVLQGSICSVQVSHGLVVNSCAYRVVLGSTSLQLGFNRDFERPCTTLDAGGTSTDFRHVLGRSRLTE